MTDNLIFEHFAALATAPDGIARLRELILQLAVRGKLGTQDAGDEPASVLVDKIKKARGKIDKKWKKIDPISDSDLPYRLPDGWVWNRLGDVVILKSGSSFDQSSDQSDSGIPYVKVGDMNNSGNEKIITTSSRFVKKSEENINEVIPKNSIIFPKRGGAIATNKKRIVNSEIFVDSNTMAMICPDSISLSYLHHWFSQVDLWSLNSGTSVPQINNKDIDPLLFPLPPLTEQHRIVAKVDRLMVLCDELEARQQQERAGCLRLGTASLAGLQNADSPKEFDALWAQVCDAFDVILDCPENVAVLRQTILQLAVQGRLERQEPGDEPAGKLVERIRKEKERLVKGGKIKHDGKYESIQSDEIPFSIPITWHWTRLEEITQKIGSGSTPRGGKAVYQTTGIPFLRSQNVWNDGLWLNNVALISPEIHSQMSGTYVQPRDILLNITGASIGRSAIVPDDFNGGNVSQHVSIVRTVDENTRYYLHYCIISPYFQNKIMDVQVGMSREGLSKKVLKDLLIPLPPLAEQHRIVAKVDTLMALCDALESLLKWRAGIQARYTGSIVKSIARGVQ